MPRTFLVVLVSILVALVRGQAAQAQFPAGTTVDQQAAKFASLVQQAKPTLVFNHHDMLWITRDSAGHHTFTFNRAYQFQPGKNPARWYLLESTDCWDISDGFGLIYARDSISNPTIISRDPTHGVIYQLIWPSNPLSGSGQFTEYRNIFLLCDADYHWRFLAEGPVGESSCNGANQFSSDQVQATARWDTANTAQITQLNSSKIAAVLRSAEPPRCVAPRLSSRTTTLRPQAISAKQEQIHFTFTMLRTTTWDIPGGEITPDLPSITLRYQMIPGKPKYDPSDGEPAAADISPGLFIRSGPMFLTASQSMSFHDLALIFNKTGLLSPHAPAPRAIVQAFQKFNCAFNSRIAPGEQIIVPENIISDE